MSPLENKEKITSLDGLRGIASLIVVVSHIFMWFTPYLHGGPALNPNLSGTSMLLFDSPLTFLYRGNSAVWLFFVLSGFVLSYGLLKQRDSIDAIRKTACKRYFRLGIPVFISVMICYLLMITGAYKAEEYGLTGKFQLAYSFSPDFFSALSDGLYGALIYGHSSYNYVLWTISIELYGSFLVFTLIALFGRNDNLLRSVSLFLCATLITSTNREFSSLALFSFGTFLSTFKIPKNQGIIKAWTGVILLLTGLYLAGFHPKSSSYFSITQATIYLSANLGIKGIWFNLLPQLGTMLILTTILFNPRIFNPLHRNTFQWLGRTSFSIYLLHSFILTIICTYIQQHHNGVIAALISLTLTVPITLFAAHFFYIHIDKYFTDMINQLFNKICDTKHTTKAATSSSQPISIHTQSSNTTDKTN